MLFSYNWLQSFFDKKLPKIKELENSIVLHSFEIDDVKKVKGDWLLDIDVRPNRFSDCFSHLGMAKEIASILDYDLKKEKISFKEGEEKIKDLISVEVKDGKACPRYTMMALTGVEVKDSPKWLKERLKLLGLKSINNVVDALNCVMLETGQPLHAFDLDKLEGKKIIVRKAKKGEKITSLDGKNYDLNQDILTINDSKDPLAIAGIKGGKKAEITKATKRIAIESANFDQVLIRKASKKIGLKTDASWVYEHGLDPNVTEMAIGKAVSLIQDLASGEVVSGLIDVYPKKRLPRVIGLKVEKVQSLLGVNISQKEIIEILKRAHLKVLDKRKGAIKVEVPTYRLDVLIAEDLIEEIGRIYGYQKIPEEFPKSNLSFPQKNEVVFWKEKVRNILKELGFVEIYNSSFINEEQAQLFGYSEKELVETENPISAEYQFLRPALIPNLLNNTEFNFKNFKEFKIFELGKVFSGAEEKNSLSGVMAFDRKNKDAFYELKGMIDTLLSSLGISDYYFDDYQPTPEESKIHIWEINRTAEVRINNKEVGFLGYISKSILNKLGIEGKVLVFDFDFDVLQKLMTEENEYQPICPYPTAVRDLSILVPRKVKVVEVLNNINRVGKELVKDIDLFDIYEGDKLPNNQKSLAFHIIYQSQEKTLSSEEINKLHNKIVEKLEDNKNWQVRK